MVIRQCEHLTLKIIPKTYYFYITQDFTHNCTVLLAYNNYYILILLAVTQNR